jgi:peptide/nickel transport system permease protein
MTRDTRGTQLIPKLSTTQIALAREPQSGSSLWGEAIRNLFRNRSAIIGIVIIVALIIIAVLAPLIAPYNPNTQLFNDEAHRGLGRLPGRPPCVWALGCPTDQPQHWMGLDLNARDMFSRVLYGSQISLVVGFVSVIASIFVGSLLGMIAGYIGGGWDNLIMRFMDALLAFPSLLLAIAIVTVLGPGLQNALLAISVVSIPAYARLARASVLQIRELEYITAVRTLGAPDARILFGHVLPNALTPLIVQGTLGIGTAVLDAAALSFLGLGAQPPDPEWGAILSEGRNRVFTEPHLVFFPGLAIMLTVLGFNLLGDGMRDALDPRLNRN